MPPKKATSTVTKKATAAEHPPYKEMIRDAILQLKERNGSSRQAIKKYVQNNNKGIKVSNFDTQFNAALKREVSAGNLVQPKGPSGPVKLQKKEAAKPAKSSDKVAKTAKKTAPKKTIATSTATKKATATKPATKPKVAPKAKSTTANTKKPRKTTATSEKPTLKKTKTGRVTKATASATKKTAAPKKPATKKKADAAPAAAASSD